MIKIIKQMYLDYALDLDRTVAQFDKTAKKLESAVKHNEYKCMCAKIAEVRAAERAQAAHKQLERADRLAAKFKALVE
jgi:hypothetical protein